MKRILLPLLLGVTFLSAVAPGSHAAVVVVRTRHYRYYGHHRRYYYSSHRMVLVPGYWTGPFWHRVWVPPRYVPA